MQLSLQNFRTLVQGMASSVQASANQILDLAVGSTLRAILEASASVGLWMQWLILQVLQMTRAATSAGADLDTWMADFSLTRLPAKPSSGLVTFSRYVAGSEALVPVGTLVRTTDGSQSFAVVEAPDASGWSQALAGYLLSAGAISLDIPVLAQTSGICGNVQPGSITVLASAIAGVDSVSNSSAFANGLDAESDSAFRLRFQTYLSSLSRATLSAVETAIVSVQQGLSYTVQESTSPSGAFQTGNFVVIIDDGSGYPSSGLLGSVYAAVDAVRPVGTTFSVFPPIVTEVNVSLSVLTAVTSSVTIVTSQIESAIASYINSLPLGASLPVTRIAQIVFDAAQVITNVSDIMLNGTPDDLSAAPFGVFKSGTIVIS